MKYNSSALHICQQQAPDPSIPLLTLDGSQAKAAYIARSAAQLDLLNFIMYLKRDYQPAPHHIIICNALDRVFAGDTTRLIICLPPRHGKTTIVSRYFPAYLFGRFPDCRIISCAHTASFATSLNRDVQRIIASEAYASLFPKVSLFGKNIRSDVRGQYLRNTSVFEIVDHQGAYRSAGIGGSITGHGFDCLPGETKIETENGATDIATLARLACPVRILSFNHSRNCCEWKEIVAIRKSRARDFYEIKTSSGRTIRATGKHRFFIARSGYRQASSLMPGDRLVIYSQTRPMLSDLQETNQQRQLNLQSMLSENAPCQDKFFDLFLLWERIFALFIRDFKKHPSWLQRSLLFAELLPKSSCYQESSPLLLWPAYQYALRKILYVMSAGNVPGKEEIKINTLSRMREHIYSKIESNNLLHKTLCLCSTFLSNERNGKFALQKWKQLCKAISRDEKDYFRERSVEVCFMPKAECNQTNKKTIKEGTLSATIHSFDSPHQRKRKGQSTGKSNSFMPGLSSNTSCIEEEIVLVQKIRTRCQPVYDFQVANNSNFFAEGVLVHNCGLIDDPFRSREDADSPVIREKIFQWYMGDFYTRRAQDARIIMVCTRWHEDDLIGRLLAVSEKDPRADQWEMLSFPAIAEETILPIDKRQPGEALWPDRFPLEELEKIRAASPYDWASLYQQNPRSAGSVEWPDSFFSPSIWATGWPAKLTIRVIALDPSKGKDSKHSDYSAFILLGRDRQGTLYCEADLERRPVQKIIADAMTLYRRFQADGFGVETNSFQELLADEIARASVEQGLQLPIFPIENYTNKLVRIRKLGAWLSRGAIRFIPTPGTQLLVKQLREFPTGQFDDGPDCLEQAISLMVRLWNGARGEKVIGRITVPE